MYLQSEEIIVEGVRVPSDHQLFEPQQKILSSINETRQSFRQD